MDKITTHKASSYNVELHQNITDMLDAKAVDTLSRDDIRKEVARMDLYLPENPPTVIQSVYSAKTGDADPALQKWTLS